MKKTIAVKRTTIVEIIASLLLIFFVHTAISTFINLQSLKNLLAFYASNFSVVAWIVLIIEGIVLSLIFVPKTRSAGFLAVILCVSYAVYQVFSKPHFPHDFGGIINNISHTQQLVLYSILLTLSVTGFCLQVFVHKSKAKPERRTVAFT